MPNNPSFPLSLLPSPYLPLPPYNRPSLSSSIPTSIPLSLSLPPSRHPPPLSLPPSLHPLTSLSLHPDIHPLSLPLSLSIYLFSLFSRALVLVPNFLLLTPLFLSLSFSFSLSLSPCFVFLHSLSLYVHSISFPVFISVSIDSS